MPEEPPQMLGGNVEPIEIQEEMERSFLDYAMSVITSRALPDARDGLKPVQRRILYGMYDQGMRPDRQHRKSANAVGHVMAVYHPHGDQAIYDALARMAQDFSLRYPLVDGQGNWGSPDPNDRPAAQRYTEARLAALAMELLGEMDWQQLAETTMDPASRTLLQVSVEDAAIADEMFSTLMGDDVDARRGFIQTNAKDVRFLDI